MADTKTSKLIGQNYTTPDIVAKVTGKAKYAEDYRAEGMLFAKLLLSQMPHARVTRIDTSEALALPGVKAILTADELTAAEAIERIRVEYESLPFNVDPIQTLRPGSPSARTTGNVWMRVPAPEMPAQAGQTGAPARPTPPRPEIREHKWTEADFAAASDGQ